MSEDTYCPECGEPISATASYCMHCYADLPQGGTENDPTEAGASGPHGSGGTGGDNPGEGSIADTAADEVGDAVDDLLGGGEGPDTTSGSEPDPTTGSGSSDDGEGSGVLGSGDHVERDTETASEQSGDDQVLDPEGAVDNTLTIAVAIVGGIVVGVVATVGLTMVTGGNPYGFLVGILVWLGSTVYLGRQYTVQGAVAKTGYAIAVVLLLLPLVAFSPLVNVQGGISGRIDTAIAIFVFALFFGVPAAVGGRIAAAFAPEV